MATSSSSSTASSTPSSSVMRINGMATGIDTDAVVKSMLASYQIKDRHSTIKQNKHWGGNKMNIKQLLQV